MPNCKQYSTQFIRLSSSAICSSIEIKPRLTKTLRHLHFKTTIPYESGVAIQERFIRANLDFKQIESKVKKQLEKVNSGNYETGEEGQAVVSDYERQFLDKLLSDLRPNAILLTFEFNPVYTGGKREKNQDIKKLIELYNYKEAYFYQASRGGQITYHGPGQLVSYPIIDLKNFSKDGGNLTARCYVNGLEQSIINTLKTGRNFKGTITEAYDIDSIRTNNTGVWIDEKTKIASIGVHVRRGITSHGVSINVNTDLSYPNHFTMCGLEDSVTSSMKQLGKITSVKDVGYSFARNFGRLFGFTKVEHYDVNGDIFMNDQLTLPSKGLVEIL